MAVSITRPAASVASNTLQTIPWTGIVAPVHAPMRADWFGLYLTTALDAEPLVWQHTDGSVSGTGVMFFPPTLAAATYEMRLFSGHTQAKLATSATFTVVAGVAVTCTAPASASANSVMTVSWAGIVDPQPTDYVELRDTLQNVYGDPVLTGGTAAGSVPLYIPLDVPPDTGYWVFLRRAAIPEYGLTSLVLAASAFITITNSAIPTIASPGAQLAGTQVLATWANIVSPAPSVQDWVGLFAIGAPASAPLGFRLLNGSASGSLPFVIPAFLPTASYQLRLYSGGDQSLLATSATFTVTAV